MLIGAALIPGYTTGSASRQCLGPRCGPTGTVRWLRPLSGSWIAAGGIVGTVPASGQAFVAAGPQVAAIGYGLTVRGFDVRTGHPLWAATLAGFPAGASIVSVRSWNQVVTVGVGFPVASASGTVRDEVVLAAPSGQRIRAYPAASYGGAVAADAGHTVVVGSTAVTGYDNRSGRPAGAGRPGGCRRRGGPTAATCT